MALILADLSAGLDPAEITELLLRMRRFCRQNFWNNRFAKAKSKMLA